MRVKITVLKNNMEDITYPKQLLDRNNREAETGYALA
jgi:hypothetical protein